MHAERSGRHEPAVEPGICDGPLLVEQADGAMVRMRIDARGIG